MLSPPASDGLPAVVLWYRDDLRTHDHAALNGAVAAAEAQGTGLLAVAQMPSRQEASPWGFDRVGPHRRAFRAQALLDLRRQWKAWGSDLWLLDGDPVDALANTLDDLALRPVQVNTQDIAAPYELDELRLLKRLLPESCSLRAYWGCSALALNALPFKPAHLPKVFTPFRQLVDDHRLREKVNPPLAQPARVPARPQPQGAPSAPALALQAAQEALWRTVANDADLPCDARSAFPWPQPDFQGGETSARAHLQRYLDGPDAPAYKQTRNGLIGTRYSSKWSPWLAQGALSGRQIVAALNEHEDRFGPNEGSGWLWFEMLWRDYFRFLMRAHGRQLFLHKGLSTLPRPRHDEAAFTAWREARTGHAFIDAGMRELAATGYLSNRMRQNVASFLVHDLGGDWRAGAAWFEHCLIDFDVNSNQGNWLYIAGRGTDPRAGRRFNPDKQARDYDADGAYRRLWA